MLTQQLPLTVTGVVSVVVPWCCPWPFVALPPACVGSLRPSSFHVVPFLSLPSPSLSPALSLVSSLVWSFHAAHTVVFWPFPTAFFDPLMLSHGVYFLAFFALFNPLIFLAVPWPLFRFLAFLLLVPRCCLFVFFQPLTSPCMHFSMFLLFQRFPPCPSCPQSNHPLTQELFCFHSQCHHTLSFDI